MLTRLMDRFVVRCPGLAWFLPVLRILMLRVAGSWLKVFEFPFVSKVDLYKLRGKRGEYGSSLDVIATLVLDRIVASPLLDGALLDVAPTLCNGLYGRVTPSWSLLA